MKILLALTTACVLMASSSLVAQEAPAMPTPQKEHEWLKQFVGEWESELKSSGIPGLPEMTCQGTIVSRPLGGFWISSRLKSDTPGMEMEGLQTIGYDPAAKKYVGTWVDAMGPHLWKYEGFVDPTGKILTLEADGPNFFSPGKMAKFRDIYEFSSPDRLLISSTIQGEDGKWVTFMKGEAKRVKEP
jgi:hypothetical protein